MNKQEKTNYMDLVDKSFYERYKSNILMFLLLVFMVSGIIIGLIWYKPLFHILGTVMFILTLDLLIDKKERTLLINDLKREWKKQ